MNIMNKLYKCALGLLTTFTLSFACFSSADFNGYYSNSSSDYTNYSSICHGSRIQVNQGQNFCFTLTKHNAGDYYLYLCSSQGQDYNSCSSLGSLRAGNLGTYCYSDPGYYYFRNNWGSCTSSSTTIFGAVMTINNSCPTCPEQFTSSECQTEYNLIPVEDINTNYCNLNFGMIDPRECPTTEGTGAISWTPRFINNEQYPGTNLLNINIPEDIAHTVIYNEEETIVNVEGYNADENYINGILQKEKLTPTNEDIEEMITGFMINYFPYLALAIVFLYLARKIYKLFK